MMARAGDAAVPAVAAVGGVSVVPSVATAAAGSESLMDAALDDATASDSDGRRKRGASEMDGADDDYDDDDDEGGEYGVGKDDLKDGKRVAGAGGKTQQQQQQRSRRHNWAPKYEMEFGLLAIERDAVSNDVTLAMCGFCKAFGREGKYDQLMQQDAEAGNDTKKRRRRSLTTTKFFRAFRVDNIRSHLLGAHPRRWSEYEMLPKQESIRSRYLQMHGDFQYDGLPIDDVVLGGSALHADSDIAYAQAQANLAEAQQGAVNGAITTTTSATGHHFSTAMAYSAGARSHFDYEKHLIEQLAIDRERLEFEKAKFKKEVELREREIAQKEKMMEQQRIFHEKQLELATQAGDQESTKLTRLAETIREALVGADNNGPNDSVV